MSDDLLSPAQIRAARGLLGWSQERLSAEAGVGLSTVKDAESGKRVPIPANMKAIKSAMEQSGLKFVPGNGNGPGVRMSENLPEMVMDFFYDEVSNFFFFHVFMNGKKYKFSISKFDREEIEYISGFEIIENNNSSFIEAMKACKVEILKIAKEMILENRTTGEVTKLHFPGI